MRKAASALLIASILLFILNLCIYAAVGGTVVNADGKPIPNAEVTAIQWSEQGPVIQKTLTDSHGRFTFTLKFDSKHKYVSYMVLADGYSWGDGGANLTDKAQDATITLLREQKLKGKIVDEQGKPVPGARITIEKVWTFGGKGRYLNFNYDSTDWRISETGSRRDGTFTLDHLTSPDDVGNGNVVISIQAPGRAMVEKTIKQSNLTEEQIITLPRECVFGGKLYLPDKTGPVAEGTPLVLHPANSETNNEREFTVGKDGRFLCSQLAPGNYRLTTGPNYVFGTKGDKDRVTYHVPEQPDWVLPAQEISIESNEAKVVDPVTVRGIVIKGKVLDLDGGKPIPDAIVATTHPGRPADKWDGIPPTCSVTDANGEFTVRVAPGDISLYVLQVMGDKGKWYWDAQPDAAPRVSFKIADGEQKNDIVLKVHPVNQSVSVEEMDRASELKDEVGKKPVIKDLILKTGSYSLNWDPDIELYHAMSWGPDKKDNEARKLMTKIPKLGSEKAKFVAFKFDGEDSKGLLLAIIDESLGTGIGYDTIYFDCNRNADLSDDTPVKMPWLGSSRYTYSKWVDTQMYQGEAGEKHAFKAPVRLEYYKNSNFEQIILQRKGAWRGKIDSNKGPLDCVAPIGFDMSELYGKHTKRVSIYTNEGDNIYIDTNGYGKAMVLWNGPHKVELDVPTKVISRYYDIDVSKGGNKVSIKPYTGKLGKFKVTSSGISGFEAKPTEVTLYNNQGIYDLNLLDGPASLPAGTYKMQKCAFNLENKSGEKTTLLCLVHDKLVIQPNKVTSIDISGKISLELAPGAEYMTLNADTANTINLRAKIGEKATIAVLGKKTFIDNCSMGNYFPSGYSYDNYLHPSVDLIDKTGKAVFSGKADTHYDNAWISDPFAVKLPALAPGSYELQISANTKTPFGTLTARKAAVVRDPEYNTLVSEYIQARKADDTSGSNSIREEILKKYSTWKIQFGKPYEVTYRNFGEFLTKDKLSAIVTWYAEKDDLRITADVTDAFFSTDPIDGYRHRASSVTFFIDPTGIKSSQNLVNVMPKGKDGIPSIQTSLQSVIGHYSMTPKGYKLDLRIPWKSLLAYKSDWKLLPVGVMLNSMTGEWRTQLQLTRGTELFDDPQGFPALVAPGR